MSDDFYRTFEEQFRGSRAVVKSRLQSYLPFVTPLLDHFRPAPAIDLGCGRGEWLEILREHGFEARGVDIDDAMLAACHDLDLEVETRDALGFLKELPDASQAIVSGFHIAEHIPFQDLKDLVKEAMRVLKGGGILILETPNPENLVVGTSSFYLDPTHQRPLPPKLLEFIPEYVGFKRTKVVRLQESEAVLNRQGPTLFDVLYGASPDYAVVAQKDGPVGLLAVTSPAFAAEYGLTLETLADRYQKHIDSRLAQVEVRLNEVINNPLWRISARLRLVMSGLHRLWLKAH
jgi:SAM-dependent methyltransferase